MDLTVHCLFHNYSDYECSAETLIGVYLTKGDAETALLELIARAEKLAAEDMAFNQRFRDCHAKYAPVRSRTLHTTNLKKEDEATLEKYSDELRAISDDQRAWRMENFGDDYSNIPDRSIDNYSIEEIEVGKVR
jgi:hypothetical protein